MNSAEVRDEMKRCIDGLREKNPPELVDLAVLNVRMVKLYEVLVSTRLTGLAEEQNGIITDTMNMLSSMMNFNSERGAKFLAIRKVIIERSEELAKEVSDV